MALPIRSTTGFSIDDESTWRVTQDNPVRDVDGLDWERCAVLHNLIVRIGWIGLGNEEIAMPKQTWWQRHITDAALEEKWSQILSTSLKQFLQHAYQAAHGINFFYYVSGISYPAGFFQSQIMDDDDHVMLTLYQMTNLPLSGHHDGLNFNQQTSRAIFCEDIQDQFVQTSNRIEWDPLEIVLSAWLDMIDTGKVIVLPDGKSKKGLWESEPWELIPFSEQDLQHAVTSFNNLVARAECLLEDPTLKPQNNMEDQLKLLAACEVQLSQTAPEVRLGLLSQEDLDNAAIPEGFIRWFLQQVRRPKSIRYIAPGLRLPTASDYSSQPFQSFVGAEEYESTVFPLPLFPADTISPTSFFRYPFQELSDLPFGLWMEQCNQKGHHEFEDGCRLRLPFEIGADGFARLTDDMLMGDNPRSGGPPRGKGEKSQLYQTGYCHFIPWHVSQLGDVLEQWSNMVGLGEWEVGEEGVLGGIEKFKEADTEENAYKYQIFSKW